MGLAHNTYVATGSAALATRWFIPDLVWRRGLQPACNLVGTATLAYDQRRLEHDVPRCCVVAAINAVDQEAKRFVRHVGNGVLRSGESGPETADAGDCIS